MGVIGRAHQSAKRELKELIVLVQWGPCERAGDLKRCHPELYDELARFYQQDPAAA